MPRKPSGCLRNSPVFERFRNSEIAQELLVHIRSQLHRELTIMEVCGTHTMAISQYGIRRAVPRHLKFLSGPGCPVCVTPTRTVDTALQMARRKDTVVLTFGDMMRVPGTHSTLEKERALGGDVRVVYSPFDGLEVARKERNKLVILIGVGFETTSPAFAATIKRAREERIENLCVLPSFKLIPPAIRTILSSGDVKVDAFLLPGHVSTIIGSRHYQFIPDDFSLPCVIAGFEPIDILHAVLMVIAQLNTRPAVQIGYTRSVKPDGNRVAQEMLWEVFSPCNSEWRGLEEIPGSGLEFNEPYRAWDATTRIEVNLPESKDPEGCICGQILTGRKLPADCPFFATRCSPTSPVGPCMVSSEGTCAAYYKYERILSD